VPKQKPIVTVRKPSPAVDLETFVSGGERSSVQTSKGLKAKTSKPPTARRGVLQRKDGRSLRRMTVYLPVDLAKRLAIRCAEEDRDISDLIAHAVDRTLRT
jgi:hypothetical protein